MPLDTLVLDKLLSWSDTATRNWGAAVDVPEWLRALGLEQYEIAFQSNAISPALLPGLTEADLKKLGIASVSHRRLLLDSIAALPTVPGGKPGLPPGADQTDLYRSSELVAERRQISVMFCDLVDSTPLSVRLDPEDLSELISAYQAHVAEVTARFGGFVALYVGDGVVIYFGWPEAHEADAERAVRAALAVVAAVGAIRVQGEILQVRVGIATGLVVVGEVFGSGRASQLAVTGATPNRASRLQQVAGPNGIAIDAITHQLIGRLFECRDMGPLTLKGLPGPTHAWLVQGESRVVNRFEALRTASSMIPLFGRQEELDLLLRRWHQAVRGEGGVVLLAGEPGIGKSRLIAALEERLRSEPCTILRYFCSPHYQDSPLYPIIGQLERTAGFAEGDTDAEKFHKLRTMLAFTITSDDDLMVVADLLSLPAKNLPTALDLFPQQRKERTFAALIRYCEAQARAKPALILVEDAHWSDPSTREVFGLVIERMAGLSILMVMTFRPDLKAPWIGRAGISLLTLGRLDRQEALSMAAEVAARALPAVLLERIVARTDGVPLFIEELTKSVLERGADSGLPESLHDSLMARLDRIPSAKAVAQLGSVIGRNFSHQLISALAELPEAILLEALDQLIASGLASRQGKPPHAMYTFKHALVGDAAYESLLKSRRRQLHAKIGAILEKGWPETQEVEPELLAHHYGRAGLAERSVGYWHKAANRAIGRFANLEAIAHCDEAVVQLRAMLPSPDRLRTELAVQLAKGVAVRAGLGYSVPESEQVFLRACDLCEELDDRIGLVHALRGLFGCYYVAARWLDAAQVADRICTAAEGLTDRVVLCIRWTMDGATRLFRGEPAEAVARLQEALRCCDECDRQTHIRLTGHEMGSLIRFHLAIAEWLIGLPETAANTMEESVAIAAHATQPFSLVQALGNSALLHTLLRKWDAAGVLASETSDLSLRHRIPDYILFGGMLSATVTAARGDVTRGAPDVRECMRQLHRVGWQCFVPILLVDVAAALSASGDVDAALETASEALCMIRANGEFAWESEALRVVGESKLATGTVCMVEIEADLRGALDIAARQGALAFQLRAATSLARLWAERGKLGESRDLLAAIYGHFTQGFDTPDLQEARELLNEICVNPPVATQK
jgi:class 3 adenylate cyclase